ncbi:hypothetical protein OF83DRAFT_1178372 [Amylostereum chailletii]|nr:hypothetical protein OF83DRAFT_1178372 [Amylostereum chailletii]
MSLEILLGILQQHPAVVHALSFEAFIQFFRLAHHLKRHIFWLSGIDDGPPEFLPDNIEEFMAVALGIDTSTILDCWSIFREEIWARDVQSVLPLPLDVYTESSGLYGTFVKHGVPRQIGETVSDWFLSLVQ